MQMQTQDADTDTNADTDADTDTDRHRYRQTQIQTDTDTDRHRQTQIQTDTDTDTDTDTSARSTDGTFIGRVVDSNCDARVAGSMPLRVAHAEEVATACDQRHGGRALLCDVLPVDVVQRRVGSNEGDPSGRRLQQRTTASAWVHLTALRRRQVRTSVSSVERKTSLASSALHADGDSGSREWARRYTGQTPATHRTRDRSCSRRCTAERSNR
jgi:hypothetical protein